jgi:hypothetical protein
VVHDDDEEEEEEEAEAALTSIALVLSGNPIQSAFGSSSGPIDDGMEDEFVGEPQLQRPIRLIIPYFPGAAATSSAPFRC